MAVQKSLSNGEEDADLSSPSIRLYHQHSLFEHVGRGLNVGFPIFELDNFSKLELANLKSCDRLFVCSEWAKGVLINRGVESDIRVIPLGVDRETFYGASPIENKPFTFFFPGKFEYRKGFDIIVETFERAFDVNDDFELVFLPQNLFIKKEEAEQWVNYLTKTKFGDKFKLIGRLELHTQVADLTRFADCVVSFSRAEGWNLPLLEALSCGRQVIATNYSGHTQFLNNKNADLIEVSDREDAIDGVFFHGTGSWLAYDDSVLDNMAAKLRSAYEAGRKYNEEGIETAKRFTWDNTARLIIDNLEN